jgi:SAM-dependent methyltransferase
MLDNSYRIGDLSPAKQRLLHRLLEREAAGPDFRNAAATSRVPAAPTLVFEAADSSAATRASYQRFYNAVSEQLNSTEFGAFAFFLNYGYVPDQNPHYAQVSLPDHFLNKNSVRLALELLGDCSLTGRRILDVGCGRGGTVSVIHRFFAPDRVTGIDLSSKAIAFCHANHKYARVSFLEADAERLPFQAEAFEIVTNLESSHSYPDIARFYSDVFRVLTHGGYFLYADLLETHRWTKSRGILGALGFTVERDRDITTNVLLSCDEIARSRTGAFGHEEAPVQVAEFLAVPGSEVYEDMRKRSCTYRILKLKKRERGRGSP